MRNFRLSRISRCLVDLTPSVASSTACVRDTLYSAAADPYCSEMTSWHGGQVERPPQRETHKVRAPRRAKRDCETLAE